MSAHQSCCKDCRRRVCKLQRCMLAAIMCLGVPVIIGAGGVERIVEIQLNDEEQGMFDNSVNAVKALNEVVERVE